MRRECKKHNVHEDLHQESKSTLAGIVERMGMVCISASIQEGILVMAREEGLEDKYLHQGKNLKALFNHHQHQLSSFKS